MNSFELLILSYLNLNLLFMVALFTWKLLAACEEMQGVARSATSSLHLSKLFLLFVLNSAIAIYAVSIYTSTMTVELPFLNYPQIFSSVTSFNGIHVQLASYLMLLLVTGVLIGLLNIFVEVLHLRKLINRCNLLKKIGGLEVLYSEEIDTPFATGLLWKKYIVLPSSLLLSRRDLAIVLKHELQHIRSRDLDWLFFARLIQVFCFWNPAVRIWKEMLQELQEIACDEEVTRNGKVPKKMYVQCLQGVVSRATDCRYSLITPMSLSSMQESANVASLRKRINAIYAYVPDKHYNNGVVLISMLPLLLVIFTLLWNTIIQASHQSDTTGEVMQNGAELRDVPSFVPDPDFGRLIRNI